MITGFPITTLHVSQKFFRISQQFPLISYWLFLHQTFSDDGFPSHYFFNLSTILIKTSSFNCSSFLDTFVGIADFLHYSFLPTFFSILADVCSPNSIFCIYTCAPSYFLRREVWWFSVTSCENNWRNKQESNPWPLASKSSLNPLPLSSNRFISLRLQHLFQWAPQYK